MEHCDHAPDDVDLPVEFDQSEEKGYRLLVCWKCRCLYIHVDWSECKGTPSVSPSPSA